MKSKRKGKSGEREVVNLLKSGGILAERTWQTAQSPDSELRGRDIKLVFDDGTTYLQLPAQVKRLSKLPRFFTDLLPMGCAFGFTREDNGKWLVLLRFSTFVKLMKKESL